MKEEIEDAVNFDFGFTTDVNTTILNAKASKTGRRPAGSLNGGG
jgi:ribosomal protein L23